MADFRDAAIVASTIDDVTRVGVEIANGVLSTPGGATGTGNNPICAADIGFFPAFVFAVAIAAAVSGALAAARPVAAAFSAGGGVVGGCCVGGATGGADGCADGGAAGGVGGGVGGRDDGGVGGCDPGGVGGCDAGGVGVCDAGGVGGGVVTILITSGASYNSRSAKVLIAIDESSARSSEPVDAYARPTFAQ